MAKIAIMGAGGIGAVYGARLAEAGHEVAWIARGEHLAALKADGSAWAAGMIERLSGLSPTSMKVSLRQLRLGRTMSYDRIVTMEYRLSQACMIGRDFYEGIRAVLVDKDKTPRWQPASLDDVSNDMVASYFEPLGLRDLVV